MENDYAIVQARLEHVDEIVPILRQADVDEISSLGVDVAKGIEASVARSVLAFTCLFEGEGVGCMWGVIPARKSDKVGTVWMVSSKILEHHKRLLLSIAKQELSKLTALFPILTNYVHQDNKSAMRFVEWLGFKVDPQVFLGPKRFIGHQITFWSKQ